MPPERVDEDRIYAKIYTVFAAMMFGYGIKCIIPTEENYQSRWFVNRELHELYKKLNPGDLLEFKRDILPYSHWAVYFENRTTAEGVIEHYVIHLAPPPDAGAKDAVDSFYNHEVWFKSNNLGKVYEATIAKTLGTDNVRINNGKDLTHKPFEGDEVVRTAKDVMLNPDQPKYNLFLQNCEHFAHYCRYGINYSSQVNYVMLHVTARLIEQAKDKIFK